MIEISKLFDIGTGIFLFGKVDISDNAKKDYIPYIRPSNNLNGTIAGYVNPLDIPEKYIYAESNIFVSIDGEGSHTYSYVAQTKFVPNSNVKVLLPIKPMTIQEKYYYAMCITANRYRFSYGRKPKGDRLPKLLVPSPTKIPDWVNNIEIPNFDKHAESYINKTKTEAILMSDEIFARYKKLGKTVALYEIFDIKYGTSLELNKLNVDKNDINFISRTSKNNGISAKVQYVDGIEPIPENTISVSVGGSILEAFLQKEKYYTGYHMMILQERVHLTDAQKLYYCICIRKNKYRYSFGRQANNTLKNLQVPSPLEIPAWVQF